MITTISTIEIGKRLAALRKQKQMTQEDIAGVLAIPRSSVAQLESGKRNLSVEELIILSQELHFSMNEFLSKDYHLESDVHTVKEEKEEYASERISVPKTNLAKFKNILIYILEQCAGKPNIGETVLYKLLYFSDFNYYELYENHLTGARYKKLDYGPVPQKIDIVLEQLIENNQLKRIRTKYHGYTQSRFIPLVKADLKTFSAAEKEVIDNVIQGMSDWSAAAISEYSHNDMPWKATNFGKDINYELAFYREQPYSVRNYDEEIEQP